jgi:hypothetical protein
VFPFLVAEAASEEVKGAEMAFNSVGNSVIRLAVASSEASWTLLFDASVMLTSAPNLLRASVVQTNGTSLRISSIRIGTGR